MSILQAILPNFLQRPLRNFRERLDNLEHSVRLLEVAIDSLIAGARYEPGDDIGFNGQALRKNIFAEIASAIPFDAIAETGTWIGNSTGFMAQTSGLPTYSCDLNPRFHAIARMRLANIATIRLTLGDSRMFIRLLVDEGLFAQTCFFYLDAHWYSDLPLVEEMTLIASNWDRFIVMIDDFKVPGDAGYGFDDYGEGRALDLDLIHSVISEYNLSAFFPASPSANETGGKRGSVVVAPAGHLTSTLEQLRSLRRWRPS